MRKALVIAAVLSLAAVGYLASTALADKPPSPPGKDPCSHGNTGKPCRPDPQPDKGKDCEHHGKEGGVNEDHCKGETQPPTTTETTTTTTETTTTTQTTTGTTSTTTTPGQTTTTSPAPTTPVVPTPPLSEPPAADKPTKKQSKNQAERKNPETGQPEKAFKGEWHPVVQGSG